jgi:hypothetical protein
MGGALGLAVLASLAAARTEGFTAAGASPQVALNSGYQAAFFVGAIFALAACVIGAWFFRTQAASATPNPHAADGAIQPRRQGLERH